jgi:hypothetical protein
MHYFIIEASSTIVLSPDGYTAESRSDSGDYYIARCTEQCFMLTPQTKEYFEAQVFIPENSIVAIGTSVNILYIYLIRSPLTNQPEKFSFS